MVPASAGKPLLPVLPVPVGGPVTREALLLLLFLLLLLLLLS